MTLIWLLPTVVLLWLVWRLLRQRDLAQAYVKRWCARERLQLLDDSVSFMGWRRWPLAPGNSDMHSGLANQLNRLRLVQQFRFEFSNDGRERRQGQLLMHRDRVLQMQIDTDAGSLLIDDHAGSDFPD